MSNSKKKIIDLRLKSLYSIFLDTSELFSRNSEDELSDYEKALLTLIASVITAGNKIDPSELKSASLFFRNNAPVDRANKLLSQLEIMLQNKESISLIEAAKVINEKLTKAEVQKLFNALIQYSIDLQIDTNEKENILYEIGRALHFSNTTVASMIEAKKNLSEKARKYGKIGGIAFVIFFLGVIIFLAGFLRSVFLGLAFAYLMDPIITFFEKKTRFSRNKICIASIIFFVTLVTLVSIKIFSSINFNDIKSFTINAPTQVWVGVEKFKKVLQEKNAPPQLIEPINQLLYGSVEFTLEDLSEFQDIDEIIKNAPLNSETNTSLQSIFKNHSEKILKASYQKRESFVNLLNEIMTFPEMRNTFVKNCFVEDEKLKTKIQNYATLDEMEQKILVRELYTTKLNLKEFTSTHESVSKQIKNFFVTDNTKYSSVFSGILSKLKFISKILIDIVLGIGFYYFFTIKFYQIGKGILEAVPVAYRYNTDQIFRKINWILEGYMRGEFLLILLEACFYTTVFYFAGIKYFYIFGIYSGVAVLVPYLGILTAYSLSLTAAIAGGMNIVTAIVFLSILYGLVNLTENLILAPKLVGDRVGLSDLETLIAIVAGGSLAGVIGVVVAIPVAAILKVFVKLLYEWYKESSFYLQEFPIEEDELKSD